MPTAGVPSFYRVRLPRPCVVGLLTAAVAVSVEAQAPVAVTVAYDISGACEVVAAGPGVHGISPAPWRCDLAGLPAKTAVDLTVTVPPGVTASDASFPRLLWVPDGQGQRGSARLPAAPAFVNVALAGGDGAVRSRWLDLLSLGATALAVGWSIVYGRRA
jgi:hypothetical protein